MSTILEEVLHRPLAPRAPILREVRLVGTPSRRYRHIDPGSPGGEGPGTARERVDTARTAAR